MEWNGEICTCANTEDDAGVFNLELLEEMKANLAKLPPVLMEIWCSSDGSCEFLQAVNGLPTRVVESEGGGLLGAVAGTSVLLYDQIARNRAILRFSDGSSKLLLKNELADVWIMLGEEWTSVRLYVKLIERSREWMRAN